MRAWEVSTLIEISGRLNEDSFRVSFETLMMEERDLSVLLTSPLRSFADACNSSLVATRFATSKSAWKLSMLDEAGIDNTASVPLSFVPSGSSPSTLGILMRAWEVSTLIEISGRLNEDSFRVSFEFLIILRVSKNPIDVTTWPDWKLPPSTSINWVRISSILLETKKENPNPTATTATAIVTTPPITTFFIFFDLGLGIGPQWQSGCPPPLS